MTSTEQLIVTSAQLTFDGLIALFDRRILAMRVPGYYPVDDAARVGRLILNGYGPEGAGAAEDYETGGVGGAKRLGLPFFDTRHRADLLDRYYDEAVPAQRHLRHMFAPFLSPIDKLRIELQELWPAGATPENLDGRAMFIGLGRVFDSGVEGLPHQDILWRDTSEPNARTIKAQLGSNMYLHCPPDGGELEVWNICPADDEYDRYCGPGSYGIDRAKLPEPAVVAKPEPGDLILFNSECIHAVRLISGEPRVSVSSFIGFRGVDAPLTMWS